MMDLMGLVHVPGGMALNIHDGPHGPGTRAGVEWPSIYMMDLMGLVHVPGGMALNI